jgi:hypothetical protein
MISRGKRCDAILGRTDETDENGCFHFESARERENREEMLVQHVLPGLKLLTLYAVEEERCLTSRMRRRVAGKLSRTTWRAMRRPRQTPAYPSAWFANTESMITTQESVTSFVILVHAFTDSTKYHCFAALCTCLFSASPILLLSASPTLRASKRPSLSRSTPA